MYRNKLAILASTALSLGFVQTASAAPPIPFTWTGYYVGVNAGYGWGRTGSSDATVAPFSTSIGGVDFPFPGGSSSVSTTPNGVIGGGQIGYNWQFAPGWLAGVEGDLQWSGQKDSGIGVFSGSFTTGCGATTCLWTNTTDVTAKLSWFGTARVRLGAVIWNNMLVYGTGGLAFGNVSVNGSNTLYLEQQSSGDNRTYRTPISFSETKAGWTLGGGIEGGIGKGPLSNWTWKLEYLHIDLGSVGGSVGSDPTVTINSFKFRDDIVRLGLNYRFAGAPAP